VAARYFDSALYPIIGRDPAYPGPAMDQPIRATLPGQASMIDGASD